MVQVVRGLMIISVGMLMSSDLLLAKSGSNSFLVTLPVVQMSRDTKARVEFNLAQKGTIAFEGAYRAPGEELRETEIEERPGDSMITSGNEYKLMVARYSNSAKMGGWYWGLGIGKRTIKADWTKDPYFGAADQFGIEDEAGKINHEVRLEGTVVEGRTGYRYVAQDMGFLIGFYVGIKHFQSKVVNSDSVETSPADDSLVAIDEHSSGVISRRMMSRFTPDIEIGWAF